MEFYSTGQDHNKRLVLIYDCEECADYFYFTPDMTPLYRMDEIEFRSQIV